MLKREHAKQAREAARFLAPIFAYRGWRWATLSYGVPTEDDLYEHIVDFMERLAGEANSFYMGSGRVTVNADRDENGKVDWYDIYLDVSRE